MKNITLPERGGGAPRRGSGGCSVRQSVSLSVVLWLLKRRPACRMKPHRWICVLGFICMSAPAAAAVHSWTVSQNPPSIFLMRVHLSAEIKCSTSLTEPTGLYLKSRFHGNRDIIYLFMQNRQITKNTTVGEFAGRIQVSPDVASGQGYAVTFRLSLLRLEDTDMYYCSWRHFNEKTARPESLPSNGTVIIIRERDPQERCMISHGLDLIFIILSMTAFVFIFFLLIGAVIVKCRRTKRHFKPARAAKRPRLDRHQHLRPQQQIPRPSADVLHYRDIL